MPLSLAPVRSESPHRLDCPLQTASNEPYGAAFFLLHKNVPVGIPWDLDNSSDHCSVMDNDKESKKNRIELPFFVQANKSTKFLRLNGLNGNIDTDARVHSNAFFLIAKSRQRVFLCAEFR